MEGNSWEEEAAVMALKDREGEGDQASSSGRLGSEPLCLPLGLSVLFCKEGDGPDRAPRRPHIVPTLNVQEQYVCGLWGAFLDSPVTILYVGLLQRRHQGTSFTSVVTSAWGSGRRSKNLTQPQPADSPVLSAATHHRVQHNAPQSSRPWFVLLPTLQASFPCGVQIRMLTIREHGNMSLKVGLLSSELLSTTCTLLGGRAGAHIKLSYNTLYCCG